MVKINIGDIIEFGRYPYDANGNIAPIKWRVLDIKDGKTLIISEEAVDCKPYNKEYDYITWEKCSLRKWLNEDFYNKAFNKEEQSRILLADVKAEKNPRYDINLGTNTKDKVFLLSINEVNKYFNSDEERKCVPTPYAIANNAGTNSNSKVGGRATCWWWLRSSGDNSDNAAFVDDDGSVYYDGDYVYFHFNAVRPALWIRM